MKRIAKTKKDTTEIAKMFLSKILLEGRPRGARVVGLSGNLGAGKTTFVKAVAKHLSIKEVVNSPTFVIIKRYPVREQVRYGAGPIKKSNIKFLFHLDAYRLKNARELMALGWKEILADDKNLVFIEWPENVTKAMPKKTRHIRISHGPDGHRHFKI